LILAVSYFVHLVATVTWLGGLVIQLLFLLPALRAAVRDQPTQYRLLALLRRRIVPFFNLSLALLIVTGLTQMAGDPNYDGLLSFDNAWSQAMLLKHLAFAGMIVCLVIGQVGVAPALNRALLLMERDKADPDTLARLHRAETRLTAISVGLSVLVLIFTAWATAL
jgi:uncharacterized membrane protein